MARSEANLKVIADFVAVNDWIAFLAKDPATRSNTSVCLTLKRRVKSEGQKDRQAAGSRRAWPLTLEPTRMRRPVSASGAVPRSKLQTCRRCCRG
jgi:hypothetical protein